MNSHPIDLSVSASWAPARQHGEEGNWASHRFQLHDENPKLAFHPTTEPGKPELHENILKEGWGRQGRRGHRLLYTSSDVARI